MRWFPGVCFSGECGAVVEQYVRCALAPRVLLRWWPVRVGPWEVGLAGFARVAVLDGSALVEG